MSSIAFHPIYLPINQGHGNARRISIDNTTNELVALMDADDIALPNRFYKQIALFLNNDKLDICGGQITEFIGDESNIIGRREVDISDSEIKKDLKKRCPMNQVTVMFKKSAYNIAGGYIDWYCEEDYYLWARMVQNGLTFENVNDDVVNVRTGLEMSSRRGGWKYFLSEKQMQRYLYDEGIISRFRYLYNVGIRFGGEIVLPNFLRNYLFKFMRKKYIPICDNLDTCGKEESMKVYGTQPFSVAMCVYGKDNPEWFDRALKSVVIDQTVKPNEVVLVVDGPIPESIDAVIKKYSQICAGGGITLLVHKFETNQGHGNARRKSLELTSNAIVALMDADDISVADRFEKQITCFVDNPELTIVGGNITEFIEDINRIVGKRIVPEFDEGIKKFMQTRCPMNQMTVMFRKDDIQSVGGYIDWYCDEDYYLWLRLALANKKFYNLQNNLVFVRVGEEMYQRRGGWQYFSSEAKLQRFMLNKKIISVPTYVMNLMKRFIVQVLLPNAVRGWVFQKFARS